MAEELDPIKVMWLIFMAMILGIWLTSSAPINPLSGNSTIIGNQANCNLASPTNVPAGCTGLARSVKSMSFLLFLLFPMIPFMFSSMLARGDSDESDSIIDGSDDGEEVGGIEGFKQRVRQRQTTRRRSRGRARYNPLTHSMEDTDQS